MFWEIVLLLGTGMLFFSGFRFVQALRKKAPKKSVLPLAVGSMLLIGAGSSQMPAEAAFLEANEIYETNSQGTVVLKGETNQAAELYIDEAEIPHKGQFDYQYQLTDAGEKQLIIKSVYQGEEITKTLTIKPSQGYLAHLEEVAENQRLTLAKTSLAYAEELPTQVNYDQAFTQIKALSQEHPDLTQRLTVVKNHLEIENSLQVLEEKLDEASLTAAKEQVKQATLQPTTYQNRLAICEKQIAEKKQAKLLASAEELLIKAEKSHQDKDYQNAAVSLKKLTKEDTDLTQRLTTLDKEIKAEKAAKEKERQAAEKAAKEKERQAAQKAAEEKDRQAAEKAAREKEQQAAQKAVETQQNQQQANEPPVGTTVYVTPTGSKYHTHKCGNGTYTESSLDAAKSRGLTPCKKCF